MALITLAVLAGCAPPPTVLAVPAAPLVITMRATEDTAPKQDLRLVPPEAYLRSYLSLFGGGSPGDVQKRARGADGAQEFDGWDDYLPALGFPDYRSDLPRATQTNAIMVATFERLGVALCDRAVERDLKAKPAVAVNDRKIFAFADVDPKDIAAFTPSFDVLHRTFLGYPAALADPSRVQDFYALYEDVVKRHRESKDKSRFLPNEAGWAAVCYGLVRHPELHLY